MASDTPHLHRRMFLVASAALAGAAATVTAKASAPADRFAHSPWRKLSDADWKRRLSPESFDVLRRDGTEPPGSSPLDKEYRKGLFVCTGCGLPLFKSEWKFHSGTGWPSFYTVIQENLGRKRDTLLVMARTEYHCAQCLGHQGHVFDDGPRPTGLRYCNDGAALKFIPGRA